MRALCLLYAVYSRSLTCSDCWSNRKRRIVVCNEPMFHYLGICVSTDIGSGDHLAFCLVGLTSCLGFGRSWVRVPLPATSVITVVSTDRPFDRARFR